MSDKDAGNSAELSFSAKSMRQITSLYMGIVDAGRVDFVAMRKRLDFFAGMLPTASGVAVEKSKICGLDAEWLIPDTAADDKVLLYWHGGAYLMGSCKSHRSVVSHIAGAAGVKALLPEYRLAPEHPFPAAIEDALMVYRGLIAEGYEPRNITVAGDSAGGGLTVAMLLSLREAGDPLPAAVCLMSPWLDLSGQGESMLSNKDHDPWFNPDDLPHVVKHYCENADLRNPLVSPVFADASGLPPVLIQVGGDEILLSDSERFAANVTAAGGTADLDVWPGMWHVWQMFIGLIPESRRAVDQVGEFINNSLSC